MSHLTQIPPLRLVGITSANSSLVVPANHVIESILVLNNTANAITGGLKFGTSSGGVDIVAALTVGANALAHVFDAAMLKRFFSKTVDQAIHIDAVTLWNSANVDVTMWLLQR